MSLCSAPPGFKRYSVTGSWINWDRPDRPLPSSSKAIPIYSSAESFTELEVDNSVDLRFIIGTTRHALLTKRIMSYVQTCLFTCKVRNDASQTCYHMDPWMESITLFLDLPR